MSGTLQAEVKRRARRAQNKRRPARVTGTRRRPSRKQAATVGGLLTSLLGLVAALIGSITVLIVTILVAVLTALLTIIGEPEPPTQKPVTAKRPKPRHGGKPPAGGRACKGKRLDGGTCENATTFGDGYCYRHRGQAPAS